jgi:hypothetical protein
MTLGNTRELGVQRLIASFVNDACAMGLGRPSSQSAEIDLIARVVRRIG